MPTPLCWLGEPHAFNMDIKASFTAEQSSVGSFRSCLIQRSVNLICQEIFEVTGKGFESSGAAIFLDFLMSFLG